MIGNRTWMLGVALAAVVIVALGWVLGISPVLTQADLASAQAQTANAQNTAQQVALVKLKNQYDNLPKLSADLKALQLAVPETSNLDDFLDQLQQLAQSTGVTITGFTALEATLYGGGAAAPAVPAPTATPGSSASASPSASPSATPATETPAASVTDRLFSVPVTIVVKGTPDQVMAFTDASQKGTRFFLITADAFTGSRDHPEDDGGTLTGFVFVVRDAPAPVTTTSK